METRKQSVVMGVINVLLDYLTLKWPTGAGEYARKVYITLFNSSETTINYYALYDSTEGICYSDFQKGGLYSDKVTYLDVSKTSVDDLVIKHKIDVFFIACAQYLVGLEKLSNVRCKTICVIHDLSYEEMYYNAMNYYFKLNDPKYGLCNKKIKRKTYIKNTLKLLYWFYRVRKRREYEKATDALLPALEMIKQNDKVIVIAVTNFTKQSLLFHYNLQSSKIKVLFSPSRVFSNISESAVNATLDELILKKTPYFFMVSANRNTKNAGKALLALERFLTINKDFHVVVVGYHKQCTNPRIHIVPFLSDSDLNMAYKHCYALVYPSYIEGFGYPPIEAMQYGKPVLASNTTSIPEVLGSAPIYFSPLYSSEIFAALMKLTDESYIEYSKKSFYQYELIHQKQEEDLKELINIILES